MWHFAAEIIKEFVGQMRTRWYMLLIGQQMWGLPQSDITHLSSVLSNQKALPVFPLQHMSSCTVRVYHVVKKVRWEGGRWEVWRVKRSPTPLVSAEPCSTALCVRVCNSHNTVT